MQACGWQRAAGLLQKRPEGEGALLSLEEKQHVDRCNAEKVRFFTIIQSFTIMQVCFFIIIQPFTIIQYLLTLKTTLFVV